jgi:hypothetical protein
VSACMASRFFDGHIAQKRGLHDTGADGVDEQRRNIERKAASERFHDSGDGRSDAPSFPGMDADDTVGEGNRTATILGGAARGDTNGVLRAALECIPGTELVLTGTSSVARVALGEESGEWSRCRRS